LAQIAGELVAKPLPRVPALPALPRWRMVVWLAALTVVVGLTAASYLAYTASFHTSIYSIQRMRAERDAWRVRNEQLRVELAKARSLSWVEHEAVTRLKMHKAGQLTYLPVDPQSMQTSGPSARTAGSR
jgi:hypothetical protein